MNRTAQAFLAVVFLIFAGLGLASSASRQPAVADGRFSGPSTPALSSSQSVASARGPSGAMISARTPIPPIQEFLEAPEYLTGVAPYSVVTADFNGDGKTDLAVADNYSNAVSILLGNGDGTFQTHMEFGVGVTPTSVAVGDFNHDGHLDLVLTNRCGTANNCKSSQGTISVLLGNGDGTFQPQVQYNTGGYPYSVAVGDFNGDGNSDLAVANGNCIAVLGGPCTSPGSVSIFLGHGNGTFAAAVNYPTQYDSVWVAVGDFNNDNKQDLAVANYCGNSGSPCNTEGTVSILLGNGNGTFQPQVAFNAGPNPISVTTADFNGDGNADLVLADYGNREGHNAAVLLGKGNGAFQARQLYETGIGPSYVAVGDVNGDGKLDLAVANLASGSVSVLDGNGDGTFQTRSDYGTGLGATSVAIADFNGDNKPDMVSANQGDDNDTVSILINNGDGTYRARFDVVAGGSPYVIGEGPYGLATADLNGDGNADIVTADLYSSYVSVLLGNGTGQYSDHVEYPVGSRPLSVAIGDFNGDSRPDLAVANSSDNTVSILLGNGDGTFQPQVTFNTGTKPFYVLTADFNGDGKLDLAVADEGANTVSILLGNGNGSFQTHVDYATGAAPTWLAAGDFNGDGKIDLVTSNANASTFSLLLGNGDGTFRAHVDTAAGSGPLSIAAADLNADGKLDVVTANNGASTVSVFLGNGNGTFQPRVDYTTGNGPTGVAVADLNGDGIPDVATSNCGVDCTLLLIGNNTVSVLLGTGGGVLSLNQNYETGDSPNAIIVGDFNNDHKPDLAAGNFNALTVSILLNTAGTKVSLASSPNPSHHGQTVTFTATVSPIIEGAGTPTGTVAFINGPSILGSASLVNGVATLQSSALTVGSHAITASYNGNVMFNGSTSPTLIQVVQP